MKRILSGLLAWLVLMFLSSAAADTIRPLEASFQMEHLAHQAVRAAIDDGNGNTLTVSLYDLEAFSAEDILNLQVGDMIISQDRQYVVETITEEFPYIVINRGQYDFSDGSLWFDRDPYGRFVAWFFDEPATTKIGSLTFDVPDQLLFLDGIAPETGDPLSVPTVHTAHAFLERYAEEKRNEKVGFDCGNVYVVFDADGHPMMIHRYHVSWQ